MENTKKNFRGHAAHGRFFEWMKNKMTGEDAFGIMYGEKGKDYPEEMKAEFAAIFEETKRTHAKLHEDRKAFMEKWKEYAPADSDFPGAGNIDGEGFRGMGNGPRGPYGRHGW